MLSLKSLKYLVQAVGKKSDPAPQKRTKWSVTNFKNQI